MCGRGGVSLREQRLGGTDVGRLRRGSLAGAEGHVHEAAAGAGRPSSPGPCFCCPRPSPRAARRELSLQEAPGAELCSLQRELRIQGQGRAEGRKSARVPPMGSVVAGDVSRTVTARGGAPTRQRGLVTSWKERASPDHQLRQEANWLLGLAAGRGRLACAALPSVHLRPRAGLWSLLPSSTDMSRRTRVWWHWGLP